MPSVLKETPLLAEAVLASEPSFDLEMAASNRFAASGADHGASVEGGTLYNVVSAALYGLRQNQCEPLTEKPLELAKPPQTYIGKLLVDIIDQSHRATMELGDDTLPKVAAHEDAEYCLLAEGKYIQTLEGVVRKSRDGMRRIDAIMSNRSLSLLGKNHGTSTAVITAKTGLNVGGIRLPRGIIGTYHLAKASRVTDQCFTYYDLSDLLSFMPCRVSLFAIPKKERLATLAMTGAKAGDTEHPMIQITDHPGIARLSKSFAEHLSAEKIRQLAASNITLVA